MHSLPTVSVEPMKSESSLYLRNQRESFREGGNDLTCLDSGSGAFVKNRLVVAGEEEDSDSRL